MMSSKYRMTISRLTVDKLGVKLYDKVSAVIAELISNSYDADATLVTVAAPMGELLATKRGTNIIDKGYTIVVEDDGIGMTPDEINDFYLTVGRERRTDARRGDQSRKFHRRVMGRKGVGKLAPFGICEEIEILSSGGELQIGKTRDGTAATGYLTAHLRLSRSNILQDTDAQYYPTVLALDGTVAPKTGTKLVLRNFAHRYVPGGEDFGRQLAQRFGLESSDWRIELIDNLKSASDPEYRRRVSSFALDVLENTRISFDAKIRSGKTIYVVMGPDGNPRPEQPGFIYETHFYLVTGWLAYAKSPYKDDLMAGVRIYCRGKIAAQTNVFNRKAGFTGEHDVRSYLIGELHADWLDDSEDLIQTDRRDILWSHELGQEFERWGQKWVLEIGKLTRGPLKKKIWETFQDISKIVDRLRKAFPGDEQKDIRESGMTLARLIAQSTRESELHDDDHVQALVSLTLNLAPHVTLTDKLREAADSTESALTAVSSILHIARVAELASFGQIALGRVEIIKRVEGLKDEPETLESAFQELITEAPWLVDPQWSPITANQSFSTLMKEFQKYYRKETGTEITFAPLVKGNKRADFVMSNQDGIIQVIEIKKPAHDLQNAEVDRIVNYVDIMERFLAADGNEEFSTLFRDFHITLVCDTLALHGSQKRAFDGFVSAGRLTHITWRTFLLRTRKMHEAFLKEAERQRKHATDGT